MVLVLRMMMRMMIMLMTAACVVVFIVAARQKHLDPRVNIESWQRDQQLLNDLNKTSTQGETFPRQTNIRGQTGRMLDL